MGGRSAKIKGSRVEREVVQRFKDNGNKAERIDARRGQFGAIKSHDVDVYVAGRPAPYCGEVKARKAIPKFWRDALGDNDFLVIKEDRQDPFFILPEQIFLELIKK